MKLLRFIAILLALCLAMPFACAESLFDLLKTPTPIPTQTPAPTRTPYMPTVQAKTDLISLLMTPTPGPSRTTMSIPTFGPLPDSEDPFMGFGYEAVDGNVRATAHIQQDGRVSKIYERVTQDDFDAYISYLEAQGFQLVSANEPGESTQAINSQKNLCFDLIYAAQVLRLTLTFVPQTTPVPTLQPTEEPVKELCPHCNMGKCKTCRGLGSVPCDSCRGSTICQRCHGKRRFSVPTWGTGGANYVDCQGCHGSGKCEKCSGSGSQPCTDCNNGVCRYCKGDYMNYPGDLYYYFGI